MRLTYSSPVKQDDFSFIKFSGGQHYVRRGDCPLVRRFYSPKVRKSEIKGFSFRRFMSPKVRKSDNDIDSFLF